MQNHPQFFMVWAHRSADSIFGASSSPVVRNGALLCFESEDKALAEIDRLNAKRSGGSNIQYSVKPTQLRMSLPQGQPKQTIDAYSIPALSSAPCAVRASKL
jgi:hypothetical protein